METIAALLESTRGRTDPVLRTATRTHGGHEFVSSVHKTGNLLRHQGVSETATVAVLDRRAAHSLFCLLGSWLLGARVRFDPPESVDSRVLFGPTDALATYDAAARTTRIGYGSPPDDPAWVHFERDMWSENPAFPETDVDPATVGLLADREYTQGDLLAAADRVVERHDLGTSDAVVIRAPLAHPGTVVAGVLAPLRAGATIVLSTGETRSETLSVVAEDENVAAQEGRIIDADASAP